MNKKLFTGIGLAVGGATLAAAGLYTEIMTSVISRRLTPLTCAIMGASAGDLEDVIPADVRDMADALKGTPMEQVSIRSHDGYVLRARWYPAEGAKRTILLAHGWRGSWNMDFSASTPYLHGQSCNLLLIDQRCHGGSGGDLISYGVLERLDVLSWLDWLESNHGGLPIYLCGVSMGAATVLMTTELDVAHRVTAIIADCGYSTAQEIVKLTIGKTLKGMTAPTLAAVNLNCKLRGGFTLKQASPVEAMAKNREIPCLFVHGDADEFVPIRMGIENYYACQAPKDAFFVHGAGHAQCFLADPEGYQRKLTEFFAAWDTRLPPPAVPQKKKCLFGKKASNG